MSQATDLRIPNEPIEPLLASYPRIRPPLSPAQEKIFAEQYKYHRTGEGKMESAAQRTEAWMHRQVAARSGSPVLEIGAGTLNHVPHEDSWQDGTYDVIEPFESLWDDSPNRDKVASFYADIVDVPRENRYARIISVAVLEHLTDLPEAIALSGLLLAEDGIFQAGIPSEGGLGWRTALACTTGLSYRVRTGLPYGPVVRHEHVNTAPEILAVVGHFFGQVRGRRWPTPLHHASLFAYIEATLPDVDRCEAFLAGRDKA